MSENMIVMSAEEGREGWLRRLGDEFIKLGPLMGIEYVVPEEGAPQWVQNVERELGATMYPLAKLKDDFYLTPKRMGALIGHSCAFGVWMVEGLEYELKKAEREIDLTKLTTEQQARGQKIFKSIAIEKICQRMGLHFRKPGRPKESERIQTAVS